MKVVSTKTKSVVDYYLKKFDFDKKTVNHLNKSYENVVRDYIKEKITDNLPTNDPTVKRLLTVKSHWGIIYNVFILDYELYVLTNNENENALDNSVNLIDYSFCLKEIIEQLNFLGNLVSEEDLKKIV